MSKQKKTKEQRERFLLSQNEIQKLASKRRGRDATITPSPDLASCWNCGNSLHYMEGVGGYCPDCGAS